MSIPDPGQLIANHLRARVARHELEGLLAIQGQARRFEPGDRLVVIAEDFGRFGNRADDPNDPVIPTMLESINPRSLASISTPNLWGRDFATSHSSLPQMRRMTDDQSRDQR